MTDPLKTNAAEAATGPYGQRYLASGKTISMRLWEGEHPLDSGHSSKREYETVGYVLSGRAELLMGGEVLILEPGDSWVVPKGVLHSYRVLERFTAVEATSPPSQGRDG